MTKKEKQKQRLELWQGRFNSALAAYSTQLQEMDRRELMYRGSDEIKPMFDSDSSESTPLVRNIVAENIESCINTVIPAPKVTAMREGDEHLAKMIEDMLQCTVERLPVEELNDLDERLCPIHGSSFFHVEWDSTADDVCLTQLGARMVIPQDGVTGSVDEMEYYFLRIPQTKGYIKRRYGIEISSEGEQYPEIRGAEASSAEDMVTHIFAYYRNDRTGIGVISWVNDTVILDDEDYSQRKELVCGECGAGGFGSCEEGVCSVCGSKKHKLVSTDSECIYIPTEIRGGRIDPFEKGVGALDGQGENGMAATVPEPVRIPAYNIGMYSLVQRKNISVFGSFLGESDVEKISTQQNVLNRLAAKMLKKNLGGGTVLSLPDDADITVEDTDGGSLRIIRPRDAASAQLIRTFTLEGDISADMALYREAYEEARQIMGITDSFQGREDSTASSAVAKQFAAAQSQGRLESKRVMKKAAWARIYELIFKLRLAYSTGKCPIALRGEEGIRYGEFDKTAFLERDADGRISYNDRFIFSCDDDAPLGRDRSAMWREAEANLSRGAYGQAGSYEALLLFWRVLESYGYPSAGMVRQTLEQRYREQMHGGPDQGQGREEVIM